MPNVLFYQTMRPLRARVLNSEWTLGILAKTRELATEQLGKPVKDPSGIMQRMLNAYK